jgi:hypothetical protein
MAAARPGAAHVRHALGLRHHLVEHAHAAQRGMGVGDQAVAADLVARKDMLVDQHHLQPAAGQLPGGGTAGRSGADHGHVAARGASGLR